MLEEMQLRRLAESTQKTYLHAVKQLALWAGKSPEEVIVEEMRAYFLYLIFLSLQPAQHYKGIIQAW